MTKHSFTGLWKINHKYSSNQRTLLKAMDKPEWQIYVINEAQEMFRLVHYTRRVGDKDIHFFGKKVSIYLNSILLKALSMIPLLTVKFDQVNYNHNLIANNKSYHHEDDQKQFGECTSVTTWKDPEKGEEQGSFVIKWYLKNNSRCMTVTHTITSDDRLKIHIHYGGSDTYKVYDRVSFTEEDKKNLREKKEFKNMNGSL